MASHRPNPLQYAPGDSLLPELTGAISLESPESSTSSSPPSPPTASDPLAGFSVDSPQVPGPTSIFGPQFPLMRLPKELRMMVYAEIFGYKRSRIGGVIGATPVLRGKTGILRVCKHVYAEARESLFHNRMVAFSECKQVNWFYKEIGQHNFGMLREVRLSMEEEENTDGSWIPAIEQLANCAPDLRFLHLYGLARWNRLTRWFNIFDDPSAFRTDVWDGFFGALSKMKQLKLLRVLAKPGSPRVAELAAALGPDVEVRGFCF